MKKYNLFTTSHSILADAVRGKKMMCCDVCTTPLFHICKPFCKYNKASVGLYLSDVLGREYDQVFRR